MRHEDLRPGDEVYVVVDGRLLKTNVACQEGRLGYMSRPEGYFKTRRFCALGTMEVYSAAELPAARKALAVAKKAARIAEAELAARILQAEALVPCLSDAGITVTSGWHGTVNCKLTVEQARLLLAAVKNEGGAS